MNAMPHLPSIDWDFANRMQSLDLGGGGTASYTYDAGGQRVRKVIQRVGGLMEERLYLGGYEIYRRRRNGKLVFERQTVHIIDDTRRIALVETKTVECDKAVGLPDVRVRYQLGNHLGSCSMEIDGAATIISYEEYHPYGTTAFWLAKSGIEISDRRYRYTGKEKDRETAFYYHGARYYAPWLGRWTAPDPAGLADSSNGYQYGLLNPITLSDPSGKLVDPNAFIDNPDADPTLIGGAEQFKTESGRFATIYDEPLRLEEPGSLPPAVNEPTQSPAPKLPPAAKPPSPAASTEEAVAAFSLGAAKGLAAGIAIEFGVGVVAGLTGVAAGTIGIGLAAFLLPFAVYGIATHWDEITATASRLVSSEGTSQDYEALGNLVGGIASIGAAGPASRAGTQVGQALRAAGKEALEVLAAAVTPALAPAGRPPIGSVPDNALATTGSGRPGSDRRPPPAAELSAGEGRNPHGSVRRVGGKQGLPRGAQSLADANKPIYRVYEELKLSAPQRDMLHGTVHDLNLGYEEILDEAYALWPHLRK